VSVDLASRAGAASPTPYAESQPQPVRRRASPDWLPVIGWFVEDGVRHTRINVIPLGNTTDPAERFVTVLKFFCGSEEPVYTYLSEPFGGDDNFRFEGQALLNAINESSFEGLVEITARSLDRPPSHFPWVDSWLEFFADDGSLSGSVPGFVFKGGTTKRVMSGKWQHWPGLAASAEYTSSVLLLNYHPRPTEVRLDLFAPSGRSLSSARLTIPPRLPQTFDLEEHIPEARRLLEPEGGFGSLRVWSAYKLPGFVLMRSRHTGAITSFDHTVPFAGPPID
jgi:hypothetical protein